MLNEKEKAELQAICLAHDAIGSYFVDPDSIVLAHWTRFKCQYGCPAYNKSLCCPPHAPSLSETENILAEYRVGLLVYFHSGVSVSQKIAGMEREIFLKNFHKVIGFGAGPCKLCKECTLDGCQFPHLARPSMEACGIDVYGTVRQHNLSVDVLTSRDDQQNCYGLLLVE